MSAPGSKEEADITPPKAPPTDEQDSFGPRNCALEDCALEGTVTVLNIRPLSKFHLHSELSVGSFFVAPAPNSHAPAGPGILFVPPITHAGRRTCIWSFSDKYVFRFIDSHVEGDAIRRVSTTLRHMIPEFTEV